MHNRIELFSRDNTEKSKRFTFNFLAILIMSISLQSAIAQNYGNEWIDYNKTYYKFKVYPNGNGAITGDENNNNINKANFNMLHRIPYSTLLANNLNNIPAQDFQLWRNGTEVPIYTSVKQGLLGANDFIEFWGEINDGMPDRGLYRSDADQMNTRWNLITDTASYFLTGNPGALNRRLTNIENAALTTTLTPDSFFTHTIKVNYHNSRYLGYGVEISGQVVRSSNYDMGEGWSDRFYAVYSLNTLLSDLKVFRNGPAAKMRFSVSGDRGLIRDMQFSINDSVIYTQSVRRLSAVTTPYINNIPTAKIISKNGSDDLNIKISSPNNPSPLSDMLRVIYAELTYPRQFSFKTDGGFEFELPANSAGNFLKIKDVYRSSGNPLPIIYDLTNLTRIEAIERNGEFWFVLPPSSVSRKLVFSTLSGAKAIRMVDALKASNFRNYSDPVNQGNFLILSNQKLFAYNGINYVEEFANYRKSLSGGNYKAKVFDVEEMYDQFSYGIRKHPLAIRNFIRFSKDKFSEKPKYVFLIGRGVAYNFFGINNSSEDLNLVPTWGNPASDNMLAAAPSNINTTPLIPIGRLAAVNGGEIRDYLEKVMEFEALENLPEGKPWQKNIVQLIGGSDPNIVNTLTQYMGNYKKIISDTFAAATVKTFTRINDPNTSANNDTIQDLLKNGTGLVSYFGHSSASTIDFNLNDPSELGNSGGKYPVFLLNGCNASEFYTLDNNRLLGLNLTLSEKFVLARQKGAISFLSSSHSGILQYLNLLTDKWHASAAYRRYGKGIGDILQDAIDQTINYVGTGEFYGRLTAEEYVLHGDPSIKLFSQQKPDYSIDGRSFSFSPTRLTTVNDSLQITTKIFNGGISKSNPVWLYISRILPDGTSRFIYKQKVSELNSEKSIINKIAILGNAEKGWNYFTATIDPLNETDEFNETNNAWKDSIFINNSDVNPVMPYNFAIVNNNAIKFTGSTINPSAEAISYRMEIDSTENFNSPLKKSFETSTGGANVYFTPTLALIDSTVYYWRLAPLTLGIPGKWNTASFIYISSGSEGFNQSHYFQQLKSTFTNIIPDDQSRKFYFDGTKNNLYLTQSIYPTSGTEDGHFSISQNGDLKIRSACLGQSIIFNVFDSTSFTPWSNMEGSRFGSAPNCGPGRDYNFEFKYYPASERKKIMDFMDSIPKGMIVAARLVLDPDNGEPGFNAYPAGKADSAMSKYWQKDTLIFGAKKSLYHYLVKQGFASLSDLSSLRTFGFYFKKDDSISFKPSYKFSKGLYDRVVLSADFSMVDTSGIVKSPAFGPANTWNQLHWNGHFLGNNPQTNNKDSILISVIGIATDGSEKTLKQFNKNQRDMDISDISATTYPYLRLQLNTYSAFTGLPYQLDYWRLNYESVPEGTVSPEIYYDFNKNPETQQFKDTLISEIDTLTFGIAFKNISKQPFKDSIFAAIRLYDSTGKEVNYISRKLKPLAAGDTLMMRFTSPTNDLLGAYNLKVDFNPNMLQRETTTDNNFFIQQFYVYGNLEGRAAPDLYENFNKKTNSTVFKDSLMGYLDNLALGVGFKNISQTNFSDSIEVELGLYNELSNKETLLKPASIRPLAAFDTEKFNFTGKIDSLDGWYKMRVSFNANNKQRERSLANNSYFRRFYVDQAPELVIDSALYYDFTRNRQNNNKFLDTLNSNTDALKFGIGIKNAGRKNFQDSIPVLLEIISDGGQVLSLPLEKSKALASMDTLKFYFEKSTVGMNGWYTLYIQFNQDGVLHEQNLSNNSFSKRFYVTNIVVPVTITSFTAAVKAETTILKWQSSNEINFDYYEVQHSTNAVNFITIGMVKSVHHIQNGDYSFTHIQPQQGKNYYRLKITNNNGTVQYSAIREVYFQQGFNVQVMPNPFSNKLKLIINGDSKPVSIILMTAKGQLLQKMNAQQTAEINTSTYPAGTYWLLVKRSNGDQIELLLEKQ